MQPKARPTSSCELGTLGLAAAGDKFAQAAPASARTLRPGARVRAVLLRWSSRPPCASRRDAPVPGSYSGAPPPPVPSALNVLRVAV